MGAYARSEFKRFYSVEHRRAGKDDSHFCARMQKAVKEEAQGIIANRWLVFPEFEQARRAFWDNICGHGMRMIEHVPPAARAGRNWINESEMQFQMASGSIFQVLGGRYPNKMRGPNPIEVEFSEWSQCNPGALDVIRPIVIANEGTLLFNTTPFGRNHAYKLWNKVINDDEWFTERLTILDTRKDAPGEDGSPVISQRAVEQMLREGVDPDFIQQEYYCSWSGVMTGSYYGRVIEQARNEGRVCSVPHLTDLPVHTAWDRGESNAVWFLQLERRRWRVIDYLETQGLSFIEVLDIMRQGHRGAYRYGAWIAGHDFFDTRDYTTGKSAYEMASSFGIIFQEAPYISVKDGIDAGRQLAARAWFDAIRTATGLDAMTTYSRKWSDEKKSFSTKPKKDWTNHGADGWRYAAVSVEIMENWQDHHSLEGRIIPTLPEVRLPKVPWGSSDNSWMGN